MFPKIIFAFMDKRLLSCLVIIILSFTLVLSQEKFTKRKIKRELKSQIRWGSTNRKISKKYAKMDVNFLETDSLKLPKESAWRCVFEDNFDSLNTVIWGKGQPWGKFQGENPHQYFSDSMIACKNGLLYLRGGYKPELFAIGDTHKIIPYAVGLVNTYPGFSDTFGYYSIRAKLPSGAATWPAFWLTGKNAWPPEIDIFEMYGERANYEFALWLY